MKLKVDIFACTWIHFFHGSEINIAFAFLVQKKSRVGRSGV